MSRRKQHADPIDAPPISMDALVIELNQMAAIVERAKLLRVARRLRAISQWLADLLLVYHEQQRSRPRQ